MSAREPRDTSDRRWRGFVDASARLAGDAEPADVFAAILDAVITLLDLEAASIGLVDATGSRVRFVLSRGPAKLDEFEVDVGVGIAGWVAKTGEGVIVNDAARDPRFFKGIDERSGFQTRAILCAPLAYEGRILGIIEAINPNRRDEFTDADLDLLTAFGAVAASALDRARTMLALRGSNAEFRAAASERYKLVLGPSGTMRAVLDLAETAAGSSSTVLLLGESGTGKEVVARAIHQWSARSGGPFVAVNCTALSTELLESELFGHERGSFTGAVAQRKGRFELADGGTLFLDEVGEIPMAMQAKLLRVLQEREFERVGDAKTRRVDVRIVAATNRDLQQEVDAGRFRQDLYYRLGVFPIEVPPLRERIADIAPLAEHFLRASSHGTDRKLRLDRQALRQLEAYSWPGNVRELQNALERARIVAAGGTLRFDGLGGAPSSTAEKRRHRAETAVATPGSVKTREQLRDEERANLENALAACGGKVFGPDGAAKLLGMKPTTLASRLKALGVVRRRGG